MTDIRTKIQSMSNEEVREQLARYMAADNSLRADITSIEVRQNPSMGARCRYSVLFVDKEGHKTAVQFPDRYSRLLYIYTLLHPQGYQRRTPAANDYLALRRLYSLLYLKDSQALLKTIASAGSSHFFSHYIAQSRKAIRQMPVSSDQLAIDRPQSHNGKVLIPFVAEGGSVTVDSSLRNNMSNL